MSYEILSKPEEIYSKMLNDINLAKKEILLETYIYSNDKIGRMFREALIKKAKEGITKLEEVFRVVGLEDL